MSNIGINPAMPYCNQCEMYHPPVPNGQKCPNAKIKSVTGDNVDFTTLFSPLKTICISQIENKKIKNYKKMFGYIIVEITKMMENYEES